MQSIVDETRETAAQMKRVEERRKWCVEQAIKVVTAPEKIVENAKLIENYLIGRWVT